MKILYLYNFHDKKRRKGRDQQEMEILIGKELRTFAKTRV